jgi:hypothetical protein
LVFFLHVFPNFSFVPSFPLAYHINQA